LKLAAHARGLCATARCQTADFGLDGNGANGWDVQSDGFMALPAGQRKYADGT